jgi:cysteine desulfurase/selenocysteine lyase
MNKAEFKKQFPIFEKEPNLVFLDNASTTQKPAVVLQALQDFYLNANANVHRGVYGLAERADQVYEDARRICAGFIGAAPEEIVFVKNATEAANLVAYAYGNVVVEKGDNIVVTELEHHSNFLPWQQLALRKGAELRVVPILENGNLDMEKLIALIDEQTRLIAITQMSNVLGNCPDLKTVIDLAHRNGAKVVVDAAQGISHLGLNVRNLDCDFAMVTGHKLFGPMGSGFLFGKKDLLAEAGAFMTGGGMIKELPTFTQAVWLDAPAKFEAGTPDVAAVYGLAAAIKWLKQFSFEEIIEHDRELVKLCRAGLGKLPGITIFGPSDEQTWTSVVSFAIEGVHPHDIASILAEDNICIRAGHHCAKPLMKALGQKATSRVSFHLYNTKEDVLKLIKGVEKVLKIFK